MTGTSATLAVRPDRSTFEHLAAEWPLAPVWAEVLADVGTPVGLFPAVAGNGPGVLLESVERSERWGRYSFLAGDPAAVVVVDDGGLHCDAAPYPPREAPRISLQPADAIGQRLEQGEDGGGKGSGMGGKPPPPPVGGRVTMVGLDVTRQTIMTPEYVETLKTADNIVFRC